MSMDKHRCKLCARVFSNGRALGGHMRSHLATLPPPTPRKKTEHPPPPQLGDGTESDSSSTQSDDPARFNPVGCNYGLRENPKRSLRASDPEFLDAGSVVQDRESETESTQTLTRRRSTKKRSGRAQRPNGSRSRAGFEPKRVKLDVKSESAAESTPVSSVSDPSCQDEEVALCLMMLSRDVWVEEKEKEKEKEQEMEMEMEMEKEKEKEKSAYSAELKTRSTRSARFKCLGCKKKFRTNTALVGHKASSKECQVEQEETTYNGNHRIYECPFCYKVFGSGQALGGHKRAHLLGGMGSSMTNTNLGPNHDLDVDVDDRNNKDGNVSNDDKVGDNTTSFMLDLNLPAPVEDYEVS